ncbi:MAG: glutamine--fructose-6-phosphate transaminase (isomerizing) [Deltaproteobacteria bacterium]|nr:glutamine--fructose-6-phosphate transaminase (isomerizing) [Deltaproteobacteria bacterium]
MCGIVGYIGSREACPILIEGLRRLEYRGYDSAGVAVMNGGTTRIVRCEGKLDRLAALVQREPPPGALGIGHTRWATHGRPSDENAHPHKFGRVAVVHNGIIENYLELRERLIAQGHAFTSETDTEIVAHLVHAALTAGAAPLAAVQAALQQLRGVYALCLVIDGVTDRFYCAKKEVPLILGFGDDEHFAAADIPAIIQHTRRIAALEDGDIAEVRRDGITIRDADAREVQRPIREVQWSAAMAEKEGYKDFMLKEIYEQPRAVADTLRGRVTPGMGAVHLDGLLTGGAPWRRVFLVACGTAFHACLVGKFLIEQLARIPVETDLASEFRYRDPLIGPGDLFIAVSQSGETADTRAALLEAKQKGAVVWAVTNVVDSSIARLADAALYTYAGPEIGVASTKAFTTQLVVLHLLALALAERREALPAASIATEIATLVALPHQMQTVLQRAPQCQAVAQALVQSDEWLFLGRGLNYPIALEGALKLKEISYAHAEGYPAGEMKHGPIALVDDAMQVVGIVPQGPYYDKVISNLEQIRARGGALTAIATEGDAAICRLATQVITIPAAVPRVQPALTVLPLQLLAYYVADGRGLNVDQPRNLAKSVTVE